MPSSSSSSSLSRSYTTLLSTLHERSSLLSTNSATIPPSLHRTLKKQIDIFAGEIDQAGRDLDRQDAKMKWDRIQEALEGDEEGRRVLLAVRDSHPNLRFDLQPVVEQSYQDASTPLSSDQPYHDDDALTPASSQQDHSALLDSQKRIFASQDDQLDTLASSIGRQRDLSLRMNEELELQSELLEDLDGDVERTGLRLGRASGQLERVRRGIKDHASLCSLFMLIVLLVTLIILFK